MRTGDGVGYADRIGQKLGHRGACQYLGVQIPLSQAHSQVQSRCWTRSGCSTGMIRALCPRPPHADAPGTGLFHLMPAFFLSQRRVTFRMTYIKKLLQLGWEEKMQGMCLRENKQSLKYQLGDIQNSDLRTGNLTRAPGKFQMQMTTWY